jgi:hypothetical protein
MLKSREERIQDLFKSYGEDFPEDITKMGEYYDKIDPDIYDEFIVLINFVAEPNSIFYAMTEFLKD